MLDFKSDGTKMVILNAGFDRKDERFELMIDGNVSEVVHKLTENE
ncbi:hypothetical protein [Litchfieldia alkalitelluris]|nr:hypothetical protein [Litchfieldia alkalitelluris]